jgi:DNA-binding MarR family transcriptional regulator
MPIEAPPVDVAGLAPRLRVSVARLARKLRREGDPEISPTLLSALATIERHQPMTAGSFAAHEQIQKSTVTRLVGVLVDRGLIERTTDPLDGRVVWLQLSAEGRRHLQRIRRRKDRYLSKRIEELDPSELATLERASDILDRLTGGER